jgi:hypothetical protein
VLSLRVSKGDVALLVYLHFALAGSSALCILGCCCVVLQPLQLCAVTTNTEAVAAAAAAAVGLLL